jgi:hypothetical protein
MKCLVAVAAVLLLCVGLADASEPSPATPEAIPHIDPHRIPGRQCR